MTAHMRVCAVPVPRGGTALQIGGIQLPRIVRPRAAKAVCAAAAQRGQGGLGAIVPPGSLERPKALSLGERCTASGDRGGPRLDDRNTRRPVLLGGGGGVCHVAAATTGPWQAQTQPPLPRSRIRR